MHIKCFALRGKCGNEIVFKCTVSRQLLAYACSTCTHSPHCFQYPFLGNDVDNMFSDQGLFNLLIIFFFTFWSLLGVEESKSFVQFFFFYLVFRPFCNYYISSSQLDLKNSVKNERACLMSQWVTSQVMSQVTDHWKLKIVIGVKHWRWWLGWATDSKWLAFI